MTTINEDLAIANNALLQIILDRVEQTEALLLAVAAEVAQPRTIMHRLWSERAIEYERADRKRMRELFNQLKSSHVG